MFPFEQSGEISFQATKNEQDLIFDNQQLEAISLSGAAATTTDTKGRGRGRKSWGDSRVGGGSASGANNDVVGVDLDMKKEKKMVHRDIERQRRHEMSALFSTLRSILPSQYTKGKRSMSDHIVESVSYIKDLQRNINGLADKRDKLKMLENGDNIGEASSSSNGCSIDIHTNAVGLQVQIVACPSQEGFSLSTALKILHQQGLDVVSCVSNTANGAFHHNIQCQASDATCDNIDVQRLQQRLHEAVC